MYLQYDQIFSALVKEVVTPYPTLDQYVPPPTPVNSSNSTIKGAEAKEAVSKHNAMIQWLWIVAIAGACVYCVFSVGNWLSSDLPSHSRPSQRRNTDGTPIDDSRPLMRRLSDEFSPDRSTLDEAIEMSVFSDDDRLRFSGI